MHTPWGQAQTKRWVAPGIVEVTTASHGGVHLDVDRNAQVHEAWRVETGWYEEDCHWAIVPLTFPHLLPRLVTVAHQHAKDWMPDEYEQAFGVQVQPAESYRRREQLFQAENAERYVVVTAWAARNIHVPAPIPHGMVGVLAKVGGRYTDGPERRFLVPDAEYHKRTGQFGFVIDEQRHAPWPVPIKV